jgi:hypothetical protein
LANGNIQVVGIGGNGVLQYSINPAGSINSSGFFSSLTANSYTLSVVDSKGCSNAITKVISTSPLPIINSINSDTSCSIAGNLELGIGTRDMIYTSLQTVLKLCPWVKYFKFNDYSKKKCSNSDSGSVSLSYY